MTDQTETKEIPKKPDLVPQDSGQVELHGFPIYWERFGNGPTIILLIPGALGKFSKLF